MKGAGIIHRFAGTPNPLDWFIPRILLLLSGLLEQQHQTQEGLGGFMFFLNTVQVLFAQDLSS